MRETCDRPTFARFLPSCTFNLTRPFRFKRFFIISCFLTEFGETYKRYVCIFRIACKSQWTRNLYFHVSVKWSKHFSLYIQVLSYWKFQNAQIKLTNTETFRVNSKVYFFEALLAEGKGNFFIEMVKLIKYWITCGDADAKNVA